MLQIVHDVAPGASLAFYTGDNSEADFASGIGTLAAAPPAGAGAKVIADDLGYFDEPFFQDGIVAQAVDSVEAQGVAYFSAAGNDGTLSYQNTAPSFADPVHQRSERRRTPAEFRYHRRDQRPPLCRSPFPRFRRAISWRSWCNGISRT